MTAPSSSSSFPPLPEASAWGTSPVAGTSASCREPTTAGKHKQKRCSFQRGAAAARVETRHREAAAAQVETQHSTVQYSERNPARTAGIVDTSLSSSGFPPACITAWETSSAFSDVLKDGSAFSAINEAAVSDLDASCVGREGSHGRSQSCSRREGPNRGRQEQGGARSGIGDQKGRTHPLVFPQLGEHDLQEADNLRTAWTRARFL